MEQKATLNHPIDRLDQIRFKMDVLTLALAGLDDSQRAHPEDALASVWLFASEIGIDMAKAISSMEAGADAAA